MELSANAKVCLFVAVATMSVSSTTGVASGTDYRLDYMRSRENFNDLKMKCRNASTMELIENPNFFINNTQIVKEKYLLRLTDGNFNVRYNISREREGEYGCSEGSRSQSNNELLVSFPNADPDISTELNVTIGEDATLVCPVLRGMMAEHYSYQWKGRFFNPITLGGRIQAAFQGAQFMLRITNISHTDGGRYTCCVKVDVPGGNPVNNYVAVRLNVRDDEDPTETSPNATESQDSQIASAPSAPSVVSHLTPSTTLITTTSSSTETTPTSHGNTDSGNSSDTNSGKDVPVLTLVICIVVITAVVVISLPLVIICSLAVVNHSHNRWFAEEVRINKDILNAPIGTIKACDHDPWPDTEL